MDTYQSDFAIEPKQVAKRTIWCGVVFALVVLLLTLNLLPPVDIHYDVRSEVLVSQTRYDQLVELAARDAEVWIDSETRPIVVTEVKLLDQAAGQDLAGASNQSSVLLVEVNTRWACSFSEDILRSWLDEGSRGKAVLADDGLSKRSSIARWNVRAAEHYAARHAYLSRQDKPGLAVSTPATSFTLTSQDKPTVPVSLASLQSASGGVRTGGSSSPSAQDDEPLKKLSAQVASARQELASVQSARQAGLDKALGLFEFAQPASLQPVSTQIPFWMAASVIVLGCSAAFTAGYFQLRLYAGSSNDPSTVAEQLSRMGVPVTGAVKIGADDTEQSDWMDFAKRQASKATRQAGRHLTRNSEWALWFWVYMIAIRFVLDSMWRSVLLESPLAALGRVIVGLP